MVDVSEHSKSMNAIQLFLALAREPDKRGILIEVCTIVYQASVKLLYLGQRLLDWSCASFIE